jgi:hypothetical protein
MHGIHGIKIFVNSGKIIIIMNERERERLFLGTAISKILMLLATAMED